MSADCPIPKRVAILGSTGSIGCSTLDVVRSQTGSFEVVGLSAGCNTDLLSEQILEFRPQVVSVRTEAGRIRLLERLSALDFPSPLPPVLVGEEGAAQVATTPEVDLVVSAMVGFAGLVPTYRAILAGKDIALANKETLVAAGALMIGAAEEKGIRLLPVDSEHNALFQCLRDEKASEVRHLWLTASGGPFFRRPREEFNSIRPADALRHPTWDMGAKITIDSATMMNKGLEVIEAHWLFSVAPESIRVLVHPQSTIHSMVEFTDGSILAQLGVTDMRLPIRHALNYPHRVEAGARYLDFMKLGALEFFEPDFEKFPCLGLAWEVLATGGIHPAALSAANEVAVEAFLGERISFTDIPRLIRNVLDQTSSAAPRQIEDVLEADRAARELAHRLLKANT